jgi:LPXTG-site transpeptidase (sortase) family protein
MSNTDPLLLPLSNYGGPTQTFALRPGSPAIDGVTYNAPNSAPATDQRGAARPQYFGYDIGAYEYQVPNPPVVSSASLPGAIPLLESQQVAIGITQIIVKFNQDLLNDGSANAANNPANYLLVRAGGNGIQTKSCASGLGVGDTQVTINSVTFNSVTFEATLNVNGGTALPAGVYQLFVCGTTSIVSVFGEELNGGWVDYDLGFSVPTTTTGGTGGTGGAGSTDSTSGTSGSGGTSNLVSLPSTGFAPNRVTSLPDQPADSSYIRLSNLWLEIPSLNIRSDIVGVPQSGNEWDVTWLGNNIGWLNSTAFPTWEGNSVLTAHVTNASGLAGPFAELNKLKHGDQVIVHMDGQQYVFEVRESKLVRPDTTAFALQDLEDNSYLTLITCSGYNPLNESYLFRRVVRAVLVSVVNE